MTKATSQIKNVLFVVLLVAAGGFAYWLDFEKDAEPAQPEPPKPSTDLTRMTMAQAITHCRALWVAWHYDQNPLAIAWHKGGLDWYVLEGMDDTSMRHFSCNGSEVTKGARYQRVLGNLVPPPTPEPRSILGDRNLFSHYAGMLDPGLRALEATEHPATRALVERRWLLAESSGSAPHVAGPEASHFATLFRLRPEGMAVESYPPLKALPPPINWLKHPKQVFALLEKEMPPDARIAELDIRDNSIKLQIVGPIKSFEDKQPAEFGDASFDEYGIRDASWWYPRDQTGSSCNPGHSLKEVAAWFAESPNANRTDMYNAYFSCRGKGKLTGKGSWTLRVPRR